jgi:hypothetical protein
MPNDRQQRSDADRPSLTRGQASPRQDQSDDAVRGRAYEIYEKRGEEPGSEVDDWLQAERELRPTREHE